MLGDLTKAQDIYIVCGYTDMRRSIDGLAAIIKLDFGMDPLCVLKMEDTSGRETPTR